MWKILVLPIIRGNIMEGFITGTQKSLPLYILASKRGNVDEAMENPEDEEWVI